MEGQNQKPTGRGGPGRGQGRKVNPLRDIEAGAETAFKLLLELKAEEQIKMLYPALSPVQKIQVLFRLREWAYGKPREALLVDPHANLTQPARRDQLKAALSIVRRPA